MLSVTLRNLMEVQSPIPCSVVVTRKVARMLVKVILVVHMSAPSMEKLSSLVLSVGA